MKRFSLPGKFILAPMAGISDAAFREQCKQYGAALTVTELTSVEGIVRKEQELKDVLDVQEGEKPAIQLFGNDKDTIVKAAKIVEPLASVIDFNIGCPAPHITSQEAGAALLMQPVHLKEILSALVEAVGIPVTAKIRAGPSENHLVYKEVALALQDAGVSMITLHPRTVKQGYGGRADWSRIKDLVELLDIPVCGNGDVTTPEDAKKMIYETGCRYVMIGRAAAGNPYLFQQCNDYLKTGSYEKITDEKRKKLFVEYAYKAESLGIKFSRIKVMAMQVARGFTGAKDLRLRVGVAQDVDELVAVFS
ncbi:tRNA-dihydrouridine synthase [Candidatus Woesearchaeota archaeon]|nr:tRNA-dihydrouridine synthase [Candidatus Woesearchaeota archaeon]